MSLRSNPDFFAPLVVGSFVSLSLASQMLLRGRRRRQMKRLASDRGLSFLNWDLPGDFPTNFLDGVRTWDKAHNVIAGLDGERLLLAFDIDVGLGKQRHNETVAAI